MHSKEGVIQGYPLAMISYGIGFLHLIRELWDAHTRVTQPWYTDDAETGRKLRRILEHFRDLQARGTPRGYFLEQTKSILVVSPRNMERVQGFL